MKPERAFQRPDHSHADDWLMTYADTITLLLCLFVVFVSVMMPKKDIPPKQEVPRPAITEPLKPLDVLEGNLPFHGTPQTDQPTENTPDETQAQSLPDLVEHLDTAANAHLEQKGDRLTTLEISSTAFFESGSARLSDEGKNILQNVAENLKADAFKDFQVTVEGHTDDSPINTLQFPSNWELSTARAAAVVHFFLDQGLPAKRLRAAGYADSFPIAPNRDETGTPLPENQAKNRRVVMKLERVDKETPAP